MSFLFFLYLNSAMQFSWEKKSSATELRLYWMESPRYLWWMKINSRGPNQNPHRRIDQADWYIEIMQDWAPTVFHRIKFVDLLCPFTCRSQLWLFPCLLGTMVRIIPSPSAVGENSRAVTCLLWLAMCMLISLSQGSTAPKVNHCSGRL